MVPKKKHPGGRPTKYKNTFPEELVEHMTGGLSFESFGGKIGVCETALYKWKNPNSPFFHKKFLQAYKKGRVASMLHWEELGHDLVLAGQGNATAWIFNMKNRFGWRDKRETDITSGGKPIKSILSGVHSNNSNQEAPEA